MREDERRKKWFAAFVGTLLFVALKLGRIIEFDGIKAPPCFYNALNNITFDEIIKLDGSCANASEFVMLLRGGDYQIEVWDRSLWKCIYYQLSSMSKMEICKYDV